MIERAHWTTLGVAIWFVGAVFVAGPTTARGDCETIARMVEKAVPVGLDDRDAMARLLAPEVGRPFAEALDLDALGERLGGTPAVEGWRSCADATRARRDARCEFADRKTGATLWFAPSTGELRFQHPGRAFDASAGRGIELSRDDGVRVAGALLDVAGVPAAERTPARANTLVAASADVTGRGPTTRLAAELHVRVDRVVAGVLVEGSHATLALGDRGAVARAAVVWPAFALAEGLTVEALLPRERIVEAVRRQVEADNACRGVASVSAELVYLDEGSLRSRDGGRRARSGRYLPALRVIVTPPPPDPDGDVPFSAEQVLWIPIFGS